MYFCFCLRKKQKKTKDICTFVHRNNSIKHTTDFVIALCNHNYVQVFSRLVTSQLAQLITVKSCLQFLYPVIVLIYNIAVLLENWQILIKTNISLVWCGRNLVTSENDLASIDFVFITATHKSIDKRTNH
jgi:hypothetical protein